MEWYVAVLKKYFVFEGRARRKEYWYFTLFNLIVSLLLGAVDGMLGSGGLLGGIYALAVLLPSLGVGVRRLHDTGRSGWWLLIVLVPFIGWLALLFFAVQDSQPGINRFGPNPKEFSA